MASQSVIRTQRLSVVTESKQAAVRDLLKRGSETSGKNIGIMWRD